MELLTRQVLIEKFCFQGLEIRVKITKVGNNYSNYCEQFKIMNFKNPTECRFIHDFYDTKKIHTVEFRVFSESIHPFSGEILFGIEDKKGNQFLFAKKGLEFY